MPWKHLATIALTVVTAVLEEQNKKKQWNIHFLNRLNGGFSTELTTISKHCDFTILFYLPTCRQKLKPIEDVCHLTVKTMKGVYYGNESNDEMAKVQ